MKKSLIKKFIYIVTAISAVTTVFAINANAATWTPATFSNQNPNAVQTFVVQYGAEENNPLNITNHINRTNATQWGNTIAISHTGGSKTLASIQNAGFETININYNLGVGTDEFTVTFTANNTGRTQSRTSIKISYEYSEKLQNMLKKIGATDVEKYSFNNSGIYSEVSVNNVANIIESEGLFNELNSKEKSLINEQITAKGVYSNYSALLNAAKQFVNTLATNFKNTSLKTESWGIVANESNYLTIISAEPAYNSLIQIVKDKVDDSFTNYNSFGELLNDAKDVSDKVTAKKFYDEYLREMNPEKIIAGESVWNQLNENTKRYVNETLAPDTYPVLLERAKNFSKNKAADEFIANHLMESETSVAKKATAENCKMIIAAKEYYEALSDEVKNIVNQRLAELGAEPYPKMLGDAPAFLPTAGPENKSNVSVKLNVPKTGDAFIIAEVLIIIAIIGVGVSAIKRK